MKVLLIDNAGLVYRNQCFCCVEGTGKFAAELVELGNEVTMFGQKVALETNVSIFDIETHGIKTAGLWRKKNKIWNYLCLYLCALRHIRRSEFIYIFYPNAFRLIAFVCSLMGKKYGLYVRGEIGLEDNTSLKIYRRASVVLTVSPKFSNMVNEKSGRQIAETIRPMLTYDDRDIVRDKEYKVKNRYELLLLCRLQREKGIIELLNALLKLKKNGVSNIHLIVAGDGDFLDQSQKECRELGLEKEVEFTGGVYDNAIKAELYKKADLYILPTYNEGFPRTLYEAMIFGVPIITTFVGGIPALMKDKENCLRIEPRSVDSIADALIYAINNYDEMGVMAKKATELVAKVVDRSRPSHAHQLYQKIENYGK